MRAPSCLCVAACTLCLFMPANRARSAQAPPAPASAPPAYMGSCIRAREATIPDRTTLERKCQISYIRLAMSRRMAQLLILAAPAGQAREDAATVEQRLGSIAWDPPDPSGMRLGEVGGDWYVITHGRSPMTFATAMWKGKSDISPALPAAMRSLGARVEVLFCQTHPKGLDRVYWVTPPGKPGFFFQVSERPPDKDGTGNYSAAMNLKSPDRPPLVPFTAKEQTEGYTYRCPSEF